MNNRHTKIIKQWFRICFPDHQKSIDSIDSINENDFNRDIWHNSYKYRQEWIDLFNRYGLDAIDFMDDRNTIIFIDLLKHIHRYDELKQNKGDN